jgi:serine/threonine protein kinase/tetratricopeptide (TPR) repeat protein
MMIGKTISHYRILEKLGEGGMGVVYKAEDAKLDRVVALKFLPPHLTSSQAEQARFLQEAKAAAALNHPNVCSVIDLREVDGQQFIVMEYVDGTPLRQLSPLAEVDDAIGYAIHIAEALQAAHGKGIVHRDVKSENVMITRDRRVKVMDFGLAKLKGSSRLTKESSTIGTLGYMAPEQIQGNDADERSDIFSFGAVLFEMLTGRLPFRGEHDAAMMYSILNEPPLSVPDLCPEAPPGIDGIIQRALEKDPGDRYQHIEEMVIELRRLRKHTGSHSRPDTHGVTRSVAAARPSPPRMKLVLGISALIVLALVVLVVVRFFPKHNPDAAPSRIRLAVLPFENLGDNGREYFADGLTGEITSKLSGISGLAVISRSSAMQYKHTSKSLQEIAKELKVDYVLEGTLQWEDNAQGGKRIRVNPALIKVADETQVWSQPYESDFSSAFKLQADIATTVAEALNVTLVASERRSLQGPLTANSEAYDIYLSALQYMTDIESENRMRIAEQLLQKAVALDSTFAAAYAALSTSQSNLYWTYFDRSETILQKSFLNASRALALDPALAAAHAAMGDYFYHGRLQYEPALREYHEALRLQPNSIEAHGGIAFVLRRQGKMRDAVEHLEVALDYDPRNYQTVFSVGETYTLLREYDRARPFLEKAAILAPETILPYDFQARIFLLEKGNTAGARAVIENAMAKKTGVGDPHFLYDLFLCDLFDGEIPAAVRRLEEFNKLDDQFLFRPKDLLLGLAYRFMNDSEKAKASFDSARRIVEKAVTQHPDDPRVFSALGLAYAGLGRKADAIREGKKGVELMPVSKEAWRGTFRLVDLAQIYTMVGEEETALNVLDTVMSDPLDALSVPLLKADPVWTPLRTRPRFQALLRKYSPGASNT